MAAGSLISIAEYLESSYSPDCDYVDGEVLERNVGEKDHGKLQRALIIYFYEHRNEWPVHVFPEQRVQVSPSRFRVPDVCVVAGREPDEQIFHEPPFICFEILSPEDRLTAVQEKVRDYLDMGVPYVWIIDPGRHEAFRCTRDGLQRVSEMVTDNAAIRIRVQDLFD